MANYWLKVAAANHNPQALSNLDSRLIDSGAGLTD
jgi:hypothetical protein